MANGILGSADPAAGDYTSVYTVPADTFSVVTVSFVNKSTTTSIKARLAFAKPGNALPEPDDYIEYETEVLPNGVLERTGIVLEADRKVFVRSDNATTAVVVYGIETSTS